MCTKPDGETHDNTGTVGTGTCIERTFWTELECKQARGLYFESCAENEVCTRSTLPKFATKLPTRYC